MRRSRLVLAAVTGTLVLFCLHGSGAPSSISASHVQEWLRWVIPLPKEVDVKQQLTLPATDICLRVRDDATAVEQQAFRKLQAVLLRRAGVDGTRGEAFNVLLGVIDAEGRIGDVMVPDASRLRELPNNDQAYLIRPVGDNRLVLAALSPAGVYYAALTLSGLLEGKARGKDVTLPLGAVTDWPDMAERGEWGCSSARDIEWLAERKMNLVEFHTVHRVEPDGTITTAINHSYLRRGHLNAVKMVPIISHLNSIGRRGAYAAYPELRGKGPRATYKGHHENLIAPCASNPKLHEIMARWMLGYAEYDSVRDISCWLGELRQRCECEECAKVGQFALEARAFVKAWQIARKTIPDLRIRVLLTQGSYATNDKVLAEIPPEVGVTYYDGGKTYDSSKDPMIYPLLEEYAAKGRWLGCYPQLTPSWRIVSPWSCPQFIKNRMTEFVDKKLVSLGGYVVPDNHLFDFNVTAAAEWSWNAYGRDEHEFALAWATRNRLAHPETVADWAVMLGPVSWDIYGARLVERYFFRPSSVEAMLAARTEPVFGQGMFRYIPDWDHLRTNLATARHALRLAEQAGSSAMLGETRAIVTYYEMLDSLCRMCTFVAERTKFGPAERQELQKELNLFTLVGGRNIEALCDWERAVRVGAGRGRFREGRQATEDTVRAVARALVPLGLRDTSRFVMSQKIGSWTGEDFRESAVIVKEVDVTECILGPGTYTVTFQYTTGWNGLGTQRVALVGHKPGAEGKRVELSIDEHNGSTGHKSSGNVYSLKLDTYETGMRYLIVANVRGTPPQSQAPGRTGCNGLIRFRRERDPDWQVRLMGVKPLSNAQAAVDLRAKFSGKGIRVGVVGGGYGAEGILKLLGQTDGMDSALIGIAHMRSDECQVVVLPQFKSGMVPPALGKQIEQFVRRGGGLITTHDAVGYRAMPVVCADICAGGTEHVRHEAWQVVAKHPVTAGLPVGKALTQSYYDQIQIKAGPKGTVLATTTNSEQPVVVAGAVGKGRYVACGLLPGFSADNMEVVPTSDESKLLLNAIRWCADAKKQ